jgi:3D (Asp-Asp-Asp) domain-containing protein
VAGIASTPDGHGYWLATVAGRVYRFGDARQFGSRRSSPAAPSTAISAIAPTPQRQGYWLLATDGTVRNFGAAARLGSARTASGVIASTLAATSDGTGYVMATTGLSRRRALLGGPTVGTEKRSQLLAVPPSRTFVGNFMVTCYDLTGITASGALAGPDSVAVDPSIIPLGTEIYVGGVGERTADDTGGAIIGDHIDIWEPTYYDCATWGVQVRPVYRVSGY